MKKVLILGICFACIGLLSFSKLNLKNNSIHPSTEDMIYQDADFREIAGSMIELISKVNESKATDLFQKYLSKNASREELVLLNNKLGLKGEYGIDGYFKKISIHTTALLEKPFLKETKGLNSQAFGKAMEQFIKDKKNMLVPDCFDIYIVTVSVCNAAYWYAIEVLGQSPSQASNDWALCLSAANLQYAICVGV